MKTYIFIIGLFLLSLYGCNDDNKLTDDGWVNRTEELRKYNEIKVSVKVGIFGTLTQKEGNCMPMFDVKDGDCKEFPVKRNIRIYEYTTGEQTKRNASGLLEVEIELIATVTCDEEGFFEAKLLPGVYSLFIEEKGDLYATVSDGLGGICPVTVESSGISEINLKLNYAVY